MLPMGCRLCILPMRFTYTQVFLIHIQLVRKNKISHCREYDFLLYEERKQNYFQFSRQNIQLSK